MQYLLLRIIKMKYIFVCRHGFVHIFAIFVFLNPLLVFAESEKDVYYDLTKEINRKLYENETDLDFSGFLLNFTGQHSPNVFYSTDKLLHEMDKLNNVARLLDENGQEQSKLYLSFQILNNSRLPASRYSDAFYDILEREPVWHVESLQEHLSGILLEVQFNQYQRCDSFENPLKVSFAKYAKAIRNDLIGNKKGSTQSSAEVGLVFNKKVCAWTRAQQFGADFIVSEVDFAIISDFPLSFNQFKKYLLNCKREGGYFSKKFTEKNETFVFKINLSNSNQPSFSPVSDNILNGIIQKSGQFYFQKLQQYAEIWTKEEKVSDLILQNNLEWSGRDRKALVERDWLLPELKVQKVDVNPCQLKTMLGTVAKHFSSVVVNEFTWAAFERHSDRMGGKNCPNSESLSVNLQLYLFFTPGIGKVWDYSGKYFEKILKEKKSGWTVQTLIFSCTDLGNTNDQAVANFAKKMHNLRGLSIGCAVNMQDDNLQRIYSGREIKSYLNSTVFKRCENIWDVTSVIILQFAPQYESLFTKYDDKWYSMLVWRMVTAQFLKKQYTNMEVILHLTNEINFPPRFKLIKGWGPNGRVTCDPDSLKWIEVQRKIQSWAAIHGIKVIFGNAFYNFEEEDDGKFEKTVFGLWNYPDESGKLGEVNVFDCDDAI